MKNEKWNGNEKFQNFRPQTYQLKISIISALKRCWNITIHTTEDLSIKCNKTYGVWG